LPSVMSLISYMGVTYTVPGADNKLGQFLGQNISPTANQKN